MGDDPPGSPVPEAEDGAHGFWFEAPFHNGAVCVDGALPCPIEISIPSRMTVRMEMCIYREGIPAHELRALCEPYEEVLPWPMRPLR